MIQSGQTRLPSGPVSAATILLWSNTPSVHELPFATRVAIRSIGRLAAAQEFGRTTHLAVALGVSETGYLMGRAASDATRARSVSSRTASFSHDDRLSELTTLVRIADQQQAHVMTPVETALRAFKLGLEVMDQDIFDEYSKKSELRLQRELCRFLLERNISTFGTKFGRSESDLRAEQQIRSVVIEVKLLKRPPAERDFNRWLTQLGTYMDQELISLSGALVVFNLTDTPLLMPAGILQGRYHLIAVNLCKMSASRRGSSVEVIPATDGSVVHVQRLGTVPGGGRDHPRTE